MNILERASAILYDRAEERDRQYGPFDESMEKTQQLAQQIAGHYLSLKDCYCVIIALKLARESHVHKEDNLLDAIVYIAQMNDHLYKSANNDEESIDRQRWRHDIMLKLSGGRKANGTSLLTDDEIKMFEKLLKDPY